MLEKYFSAPKTLDRLRGGPSGPYIDGFAGALDRDGYSQASAVGYLRAAAHLGRFLQRHGGTLADIDASRLEAFRRHLPRCRCPLSNGGRANHHVFFGAKHFRAHLFQTGICESNPSRLVSEAPRRRRIDSQAILSWRSRSTQHTRGGSQPMECAADTDVLARSSQSVWG
jgi:hypothetical protein